MTRRSLSLLTGLLALTGATIAAGRPAVEPREETGRDRHERRRRARRIAAELRLDVEQVYRDLGAGRSEEQIRAAAREAGSTLVYDGVELRIDGEIVECESVEVVERRRGR